MKKILFSILLLSISFNLIAKEKITSVYTSISEKNCTYTLKGIFKEQYNVTDDDAIFDGGVEECQGYDKYKVAIPSSEDRSWLDISDGKSIWSTSNQVVYSGTGYFPNLRQGSKLEWRINEAKKPTAVIFRIYYQDPNDYKKYVSKLFVVNLKDSEPKFCGYVITNEEARTLADTGKCTEKLNKIF